MKTLDIAEAKSPLGQYVSNRKAMPVVVTRRGVPIAALMPISNADPETVSLSTNPRFLALIERSRRHQAAQGGLSSEEMRRRLGCERPPKCRKAKTAVSTAG